MMDSNVDGLDFGADEECEFASRHLGLGRIPGLALDELTEVVAHKNGYVVGRPTNAFGDRYEPFMTGYVKGYRRALFQIATARFGPPGRHDDVIWALKDLREIVELLDRVATATSWNDLLEPFYDRVRASIEQRIAKAYVFVMETGKQRFGPPPKTVQQAIDNQCIHHEHWALERLAERVLEAKSWDALIANDR